jgi:flavin-dependent dehydrogenase
VLDSILVEAAVAAGVEFREGFSVQELLWHDGAVAGIRGHSKGGSPVPERARITIGADGMHSLVARAVKASEYNAKPALQGPYFSYWSGVQMRGFEFYPGLFRGVFGWMTNDDLALIGVGFAAKDHPSVKANIEERYLQAIREDASALAARMSGGRREERIIGGLVPNYFRKPFGPGWALVGDAAYLKDPCTAEGITDAFHSATWLADALHAAWSGAAPMDTALARYEQTRNDVALPLYDFTCQLATLAPPPPEMARLLAALQGNQEQTDRFFGLFAQTVSVPDFFAPSNVERILSAAQSPPSTPPRD